MHAMRRQVPTIGGLFSWRYPEDFPKASSFAASTAA